MRLLDDIIGKEILDSSGNIIGKVKDIEIDTSKNKISSIITTKEKSKKRFGTSSEEEKIPFEMISHIGDKIILKDLLNIHNRINL